MAGVLSEAVAWGSAGIALPRPVIGAGLITLLLWLASLRARNLLALAIAAGLVLGVLAVPAQQLPRQTHQEMRPRRAAYAVQLTGDVHILERHGKRTYRLKAGDAATFRISGNSLVPLGATVVEIQGAADGEEPGGIGAVPVLLAGSEGAGTITGRRGVLFQLSGVTWKLSATGHGVAVGRIKPTKLASYRVGKGFAALFSVGTRQAHPLGGTRTVVTGVGTAPAPR